MREAGVVPDSAVVTTLHRRRLELGEAEQAAEQLGLAVQRKQLPAETAAATATNALTMLVCLNILLENTLEDALSS